MYENWKIAKNELEEKADEYTQVAEWCNSTGAYTIVENRDFYAVVQVEVPESNPEVAEDEQLVEDNSL